MLTLGMQVQAQSVSQIKADESYIYGEGRGSTLKQADNAALQDLTSKISVTVNSSSFMEMKNVQAGGDADSKVTFEKLMRTYSQATLTNTQRIVIQNEPDAQVLRYIKASEIDRIFEGRKVKVMDMVDLAERAEKRAKIDDALRYYYWAFELLKSIQHPNEVRYNCPDGKQRLLMTWIPEQINDIFSHVKVTATSTSGNEVQLMITYKGLPVASFDYTYFDGMDWSNIYSAKDGHGVIDLRPGQTAENLKVKCEYAYEGETHIDREIESVMALVDGTPFRNAYINVVGTPKQAQTASLKMVQPVQVAATAASSAVATPLGSYDAYMNILNDVSKAIRQKNYDAISGLFTEKGKSQFKQLISYGRAALIGKRISSLTNWATR